MTERPLYESLIADGTINRRHEIALMRFAACWRAAKKARWQCSSDDPDFLTAQYAFVTGNLCAHVVSLADFLVAPYDPHCTLSDFLECLHMDAADIDGILAAVGEFLAVDHPARYREWKARQAEELAKIAADTNCSDIGDVPRFLRRARERSRPRRLPAPAYRPASPPSTGWPPRPAHA